MSKVKTKVHVAVKQAEAMIIMNIMNWTINRYHFRFISENSGMNKISNKKEKIAAYLNNNLYLINRIMKVKVFI